MSVRATGWLALSGAAIGSARCWEYVLPMAYYVWAQPTWRIARITATTKPPITAALAVLFGLAVLSLASATFGAARASARRARAALLLLGAHLLVVLTAIVATSPLRREEELLESGMLRARDAYVSAYAAGLCVWQAWASSVFVVLAVLAVPLLRSKAGAVPALRLAATSLLVLAPFSFAWLAGEWTVAIVVAALPFWVTAEILASRVVAPRRPTG